MLNIKARVIAERERHAPFFSSRLGQERPDLKLHNEFEKENTGDPGFQPLKKKREGKSKFSTKLINQGDPLDSDDEREKRKNYKVAWESPPLNEPAKIANLKEIIESIKQPNIVWDHGETKLGKKSDANFLKWLEEYSRLEHKKKVDEDDLAFQ